MRGINEKGHVANFVETEQILQLADVACSYVQVIIDNLLKIIKPWIGNET